MFTDYILTFRNLPLEINSRQRVIYDSLGFTLEMIDYNFNELEKRLRNISQTNKQQVKLPELFTFCWNIVDSTIRFIKIYKLLPSPTGHQLVKSILHVNKFRNTFQHLDERGDEVIFEKGRPFFGAIKWIYKNFDNNKIKALIAISGIYSGKPHKFYYPKQNEVDKDIYRIVLESVDKRKVIELDLSMLMSDLKKIIQTMETKIKSQIQNSKFEPADFKKRRDIILRLNNE